MTLQGLGHTPCFIPRTVSVLCVLHYVMLFVTITPLLRSMEGTCHGQVCIVVFVVSVLAALVVCVAYMYVLWCLERTWCCQCLLHLAYVLALCGAWSAIWQMHHMIIPRDVFAICGAWSAPICWLHVLWGA